MHPQSSVGTVGWFQSFFHAKHFGSVLALSFSLFLAACGGGGSVVTENDLPEPGADGIAPTLTSVSLLQQQEKNSSPDGVAKLGQSIKVDFTASEALMLPVVTINGVEATLQGKIGDWSASREMVESDVDGYVTFSISFSDTSGEVGVDVSETTDGSRVQYCKEGCVAPVEDPLVGEWMLDGVGAAGVGPTAGSMEWFTTDADVVAARACWFDDSFVFGLDGSFSNEMGTDTWVEAWQGGTDSCGAPVAPHDGTAAGTWVWDEAAGTLTIKGKGAHLGLPKAVNGQELATPSAAPDSITYNILTLTADGMNLTVTVETAPGVWWTFNLAKNSSVVADPVVADPVVEDLGTGDNNVLNVGEVINFNSTTVGVYALADFGNNVSTLVADPTDATNTVVSVVKGNETWAGTTIASGLVIYPLTATETVMSVRVWSPEAGITVRLKLEESGDPTHSVETDAVTTKAQEWETLTFDFSNQGEGTAELNTDYVFDKLSIFLNFDSAGSSETYYFDDVTFVGAAAVVATTVTAANLVGDWKIAPVAGALAVGESADNLGWWSSDEETVTTRACLFDDVFTFGSDGSFSQAMGAETWVEPWQGTDPEACAAPVAPHDGSYTDGTYSVADSKVTVNGFGAHLGLPKVTGSGEISDTANAVSTITYNITELSADGNNMTVQIQYNGANTWQFKLAKA